jgi:hypothetical protein
MIVGRCTAGGCNVLTIGPHCVDHDVPVTRTFTRGRPFRRSETTAAALPARAEPALPVDTRAPIAQPVGLVTVS